MIGNNVYFQICLNKECSELEGGNENKMWTLPSKGLGLSEEDKTDRELTVIMEECYYHDPSSNVVGP